MITELENIMKVGDVPSFRLSEAALNFMLEQDRSYRDEYLEEHLYNMSDILELEVVVPDDVRPELEHIHKLLNANDCAYLRITF